MLKVLGDCWCANLTPRPGVDDKGLSTFETSEAAAPNGARVQVSDACRLKLVQARPDSPPVGHVSVVPADGGNFAEWASDAGA